MPTTDARSDRIDRQPTTLFRECERCKTTTDRGEFIAQLTSCPLVGRPWLCTGCVTAHFQGCRGCKGVWAQAKAGA
jgi:hypothetical protein